MAQSIAGCARVTPPSPVPPSLTHNSVPLQQIVRCGSIATFRHRAWPSYPQFCSISALGRPEAPRAISVKQQHPDRVQPPRIRAKEVRALRCIGSVLQEGDEQISSEDQREGDGDAKEEEGGEEEEDDPSNACCVCQGPDYKVVSVHLLPLPIHEIGPLNTQANFGSSREGLGQMGCCEFKVIPIAEYEWNQESVRQKAAEGGRGRALCAVLLQGAVSLVRMVPMTHPISAMKLHGSIKPGRGTNVGVCVQVYQSDDKKEFEIFCLAPGLQLEEIRSALPLPESTPNENRNGHR